MQLLTSDPCWSLQTRPPVTHDDSSVSVLWIPILNLRVPSYCNTSHSIHCSAFCGLVGYDTISQRNTVPPSSFILNMGTANSSEFLVACYHQPKGLLTQKTTLTAVITHTHTYIYIYIYIQFLTTIIRTSGSILAYKVRRSISDMCMVLFLCHKYVLHVSNNGLILLLCHDCVLHIYQTVQ